MTIKEVVTILAERTGRQFDLPFQQELYVIAQGWRSRIMRQTLERNLHDRQHFQDGFHMDLIDVDISECAELGLCTIRRTKFKVPRPVRANNTLYEYIGGPGFEEPFDRAQMWARKFRRTSKHSGDRPMYMYKNGYIYIPDEPELLKIGVQGIIEDVRQLAEVKTCGDSCAESYVEFNMPGEIGQAVIQSALSTELRMLIQDKVEITPEPKPLNS